MVRKSVRPTDSACDYFSMRLVHVQGITQARGRFHFTTVALVCVTSLLDQVFYGLPP